METTTLDSVRHQLEDRRGRLREAIAELGSSDDLVRLLQQVDSALGRMGADDFARCLVCREHVDDEEVVLNPLAQYCLCKLSPPQQRALEQDLGVAWKIQSALLPDPDLRAEGWRFHYRYEPAGPVSGDYCDLWAPTRDGRGTYFFVGDVSGKGISASLLMAHLHAGLRSRLDGRIELPELVAHANRLFLGHSIASHYATLVSGRAMADGEVEIVNAGHCPPILLRRDGLETVDSSGLPIGLVDGRPYEIRRLRLAPGEALFLYTDGLTEARAQDGSDYGSERLEALLRARYGQSPRELAAGARADLRRFLAGSHQTDDLTILVVQREGSE